MSELKINEKCWIEYKECIYLGEEDGKHKVRIETKEGFEIKFINYVPIINTFHPKEYYKDKNGKIYVFSGKTTCWKRDGRLVLYYKFLIPSDTFKGYDHLPESNIRKDLEETNNPFWDEHDIYKLLDETEKECSPILNKISELKNQVSEIRKKTKEAQEHCFHSWEKGEEEETGRNFFGRGKQRTDVCNICGLKKTIYYSSL